MAKLQVWNSWLEEGVNNWLQEMDSVGGVTVKFNFKNLTGKTIKYAEFYFIPYNSVGDPVCCSIKGICEGGVRYTGFVNPGNRVYNVTWENAWYNSTIVVACMTEAYLYYSDGTEERIELSDIEFSGDYAPANGGGCYVATAVYGSYDCPQVWTLRRYRDDTLAETWYGRAFIRTYYAISPTLVKWFGETEWFKNFWKGKLDKMVAKLQAKGVESDPYEDKNW